MFLLLQLPAPKPVVLLFIYACLFIVAKGFAPGRYCWELTDSPSDTPCTCFSWRGLNDLPLEFETGR